MLSTLPLSPHPALLPPTSRSHASTSSIITSTPTGTAFTPIQRSSHNLTGLVPPTTEQLATQIQRSLSYLSYLKAHASPLEQYTYLDRIRSENAVLFYAIVLEKLREVVGLIYTPTVGLACQQFSKVYVPGQSTQGLFLSMQDADHLDEILANWENQGSRPEPEICVMTDGSRILGLGDLGVNGMGIPIGKLSLYVAAAGLDPSKTLPITLDMGCNTPHYVEDPFYLGTRMKRPEDPEFFGFVDKVMVALKRRWPKMLIQFEDFASEHAFQTLERYREDWFCFNDDIQVSDAF
jgi:malate dehydrogenase (oxaloacetate-decarboxylating)(NADP+)